MKKNVLKKYNTKKIKPHLPLKFCTGCSACLSICNHKVLRMQENKEGFLYPVIDEASCVSCKACEKICPVLHPIRIPSVDDKESFAAIANNDIVRSQSSSGEIFTVLAQYILSLGGIVFGARFTEDFSVIHDFTDTEEGLVAFRGSKYVQSDMRSSYITCKQFLDQNRYVLFSGTPCEIGGYMHILEELMKNYTLLI